MIFFLWTWWIIKWVLQMDFQPWEKLYWNTCKIVVLFTVILADNRMFDIMFDPLNCIEICQCVWNICKSYSEVLALSSVLYLWKSLCRNYQKMFKSIASVSFVWPTCCHVLFISLFTLLIQSHSLIYNLLSTCRFWTV